MWLPTTRNRCSSLWPQISPLLSLFFAQESLMPSAGAGSNLARYLLKLSPPPPDQRECSDLLSLIGPERAATWGGVWMRSLKHLFNNPLLMLSFSTPPFPLENSAANIAVAALHYLHIWNESDGASAAENGWVFCFTSVLIWFFLLFASTVHRHLYNFTLETREARASSS